MGRITILDDGSDYAILISEKQREILCYAVGNYIRDLQRSHEQSIDLELEMEIGLLRSLSDLHSQPVPT